MKGEDGHSRRDFIRGVGLAAGAAALGTNPIGVTGMTFPERLAPAPPSPYPELNDRALGWLRFLWEKTTTDDDWSRWGVPHVWWDRYTFPGVTGYPRFDLQYSSYAVLLMADQTPAWREVYTRIADGLATRYPTYWGAVDWLTQIGPDPARANYPPQFRNGVPEELRGAYDRIGWTANGVEPWGLQPDPIGSDGNLFFRGWFGLVLSIYRYVSGDEKWARPFAVTGYEGQDFEWDHHRMVELLERQWRDHPEGPHCENTKIWTFCNSAAGLGVYLYDRIHGTDRHRAVRGWLEYLKDNYMGVSSDGRLEWFTTWYDPMIDHKANGGAESGLGSAFLLLPQDPELASFVYESSANAAGWSDPSRPVRPSSAGLLMARELGDDAAVIRLSAAAEAAYDPRFFGEGDEMFGWWFGLNDPYPRGQRSAMMMISEIGRGGEWGRAFEAPYMDKFTAPTVEGIDFPSLGVRQAWNDPESGALYVRTYAAAKSMRGAETSWRVTNLPDAGAAYVICDGQPFDRFEVEGPGTIRLDTDIDQHEFHIFSGYRGGSGVPQGPPTPDASGAPRRAAGLAMAEREGRGGGDGARGAVDAPVDAISPGCGGCRCSG